ncbi:MAG: hypothetical protein HY569_03020 [Candidatus Magasanikbacteria bacterium]|nr:hypothetical protein [Candidatus Magasanikbacteria bacterium]
MPEEGEKNAPDVKAPPASEWMTQIENALEKTLPDLPPDALRQINDIIKKTVQGELEKLRDSLAENPPEQNLEDALDEFEEEEEPVNQALDFGDELEQDYAELGIENTAEPENSQKSPPQPTKKHIGRRTPEQTPTEPVESAGQPSLAKEESTEPSPAYVPSPSTEPQEPTETPLQTDSAAQPKEPSGPQEKKSEEARPEEQEEKPAEKLTKTPAKQEQSQEEVEPKDGEGKKPPEQSPEQPTDKQQNKQPDEQQPETTPAEQETAPQQQEQDQQPPPQQQEQIKDLTEKLQLAQKDTGKKVDKAIKPFQKEIAVLKNEIKLLEAKKAAVYVKMTIAAARYFAMLVIAAIVFIIGVILSLFGIGEVLMGWAAKQAISESATFSKNMLEYNNELQKLNAQIREKTARIKILEKQMMNIQRAANIKFAALQGKIAARIQQLHQPNQ